VALPDLRDWFDEEELELCPNCSQRAGVTVDDANSFICFDCGFISWSGGETSVALLQGREAPAV
jgi:hypothetical protein